MSAQAINIQQAGSSGRTITRISRFLAFATMIGVIVLPLIVITIWMFPNLVTAQTIGLGYSEFELSNASLAARSVGLVVALAGVAIQIYGLLGLRRTFQESAKGNWFSLRSIQGFHRFAWVSLAMVFVGIVQASAWSVILSMGTPGVENQLTIGFGSGEITKLFTALLFVFVAHIFLAGRAADEENASFI